MAMMTTDFPEIQRMWLEQSQTKAMLAQKKLAPAPQQEHGKEPSQ